MSVAIDLDMKEMALRTLYGLRIVSNPSETGVVGCSIPLYMSPDRIESVRAALK